MLEKAGCHVIYGLDGLKVHSKLCLITMKNGEDIKYITQIGTGNYNEKTARLYTDLCLMTANDKIGAEAARVFHLLSLGEVIKRTESLLVAPKCLQNKVLDKIEREIQISKDGGDAYIGIKINSLTDKKIIDKLIEASEAGVKIEMVVRGICCLHPGRPGKTDNIRIVSIVGRFLEHSRIYIFGKGEREEIYIGSADFMTRNTVRRVEVAAPIYDPAIRERIRHIFRLQMEDNVKARELHSDGNYTYVPHKEPSLDSQEAQYEEAYQAVGTLETKEEPANAAAPAKAAEMAAPVKPSDAAAPAKQTDES
jgi:polyphosphate kinase